MRLLWEILFRILRIFKLNWIASGIDAQLNIRFHLWWGFWDTGQQKTDDLRVGRTHRQAECEVLTKGELLEVYLILRNDSKLMNLLWLYWLCNASMYLKYKIWGCDHGSIGKRSTCKCQHSHMGACLCPGCSTCLLAPCLWCGKEVGHGLKPLDPTPTWET